MNSKFFLVLIISSLTLSAQVPYKDPQLAIETRTQDLLKRMTIEEKVGQLLCPMGWEMWEKSGNTINYSQTFKDLIDKKYVGSFWGVYRADPWTKKTLQTGLNPELAAKAGNALQKYVMENSRLGIPLFLAEESPHGHMAIGTTVFPTGIGLASTWNPVLIEKAASVMAKEVRLQGGHVSYGPVLDLSRDPRWSRVEESYGEDPVLTSRIAEGAVRGGGGGNLSKPYSVVSTLKHFIAYGIPEGGHNGNTALIGQRELHENFFPPFKAAIDAGAGSVMTAYNSIDGVPCTSNEYLYADLLRKQWGFKGVVVSDLFSINGLSGSHNVAKNLSEAGEMALSAGVDLDLGASAFANLSQSLEENKVSLASLDSAVARILRQKFEMGLFENPYVDTEKTQSEVRTAEHIQVAREVARQSIVLLENKKGMLPLAKDVKRIAVIGPNADNVYNQLGDYTAPQEEGNVITVYQGLKNKFKNTQVSYTKGCSIRDVSDADIKSAVKAVRKADVAVVVVGGSSARDFKTEYIETGAAVTNPSTMADIESGEGFDRATLSLLGKQQELLEAVKATGKPLIVVYIQGRPLEMNWAKENADALICAWYPGQEGGTVIAEMLAGEINPSGRMPISVPKYVGQIPVYYNKKNPKGHDYVEMDAAPLYPFGYGIGFSSFGYSGLKIAKSGKTDFTVSFDLKNEGKYDGEEVVQLYVRDEVASVVQPIKQLKQFTRVSLKAGENKTVDFKLSAEDLAIIDKNLNKTVESGDFTLMIGASSADIRLKEKISVE